MNRWRIFSTGNQMAGREMSQKRKKLTQSAVVVPEPAGKVFGIVVRSFAATSAAAGLALGGICYSPSSSIPPGS